MKENKNEYGSRFLYAEDLLSGGEYRTATVEIEQVIPPNELTAANGKKVDKPTLKFKGKDKMLVLCKTNQSMIVFCTGGPLCDAAGKSITLQVREVDAFGEQVVALRVMPEPGVKVRKSILQRLGKKAMWKTVQGDAK